MTSSILFGRPTRADSHSPMMTASDISKSSHQQASAHVHRTTQDQHNASLELALVNYQKSTEKLLLDYEKLQTENTRLRGYISGVAPMTELLEEKDKYAILLIDGSRTSFNDQMVSHGIAGGRHLSHEFYKFVYQTLAQHTDCWKPPQTLYVKYYVNVHAKCQELVKHGTIRTSNEYIDFLDGFSQYSAIDCVQTGSEQSLTDNLMGAVRGHLSNAACTAVVIGSSMNNGIIKELREVNTHYPREAQRLYIMTEPNHVPDALAYDMKPIPGPPDLFHSSLRTVSRSTTYSDTDSEAVSLHDDLPSTCDALKPLAVEADKPVGIVSSAGGSWAAIVKQAPPPPGRSASNTFSATDSRPNSRATTDQTRPSLKVIDVTSKLKKENKPARDGDTHQHPNVDVLKQCTQDENGIYWSKQGNRIDPCPKWYNKEEVERVKKMKLCNIHYLRPPCHSDKKCVHNHSYKVAKPELETLALVARMSPCQNGPQCEDDPCIYGHNCPAPRHGHPSKIKGGSTAIKEGKLCIFGVECFFNGDMHHYAD